MRKIAILFLAAGLFAASCNNKAKKDSNNGPLEKDDYLDGKKTGNDDNGDSKNTGSWTAADKEKFNGDCRSTLEKEGVTGDVIEKMCPCLLDKFSAKYSSASDMDKNSSSAEGEQMAKQCAADLGLGNDNNSGNQAAGGWSSADEQKFLDECKGTAVPNVGAARAGQYCGCMLDKLKSMYSSYDEANEKLKNITEAQLNALAADCNK